MRSVEIRRKFTQFFQKNQHQEFRGSSLIPENDSSLLFVNAGMNQFKDVFLGLTEPPFENLVTIQKCLRAGGKHNDIESVGETPLHHTFFEMLGNFSFGGYFKSQAVDLAWEFLTKELEIPEEHLWITVHQEDEDSYAIWRDKKNIPEHKIYKMGDKDNFWSMGDTGPCGPCSEIHYYKGREKHPDPSQFMEIWNLVFMEFYDKYVGVGAQQKIREKLPKPCVDTGMGLERLCSIFQDKDSNYHTDLFKEVIVKLEKISGKKYDWTESQQSEEQKAFRVLADHSRAVSFLIADNVYPGNTGSEYVLRRIMRRALYYSQKLNNERNLLWKGAEQVVSLMGDYYSELKEEQNQIQSHIEGEAEKFFKNLKEGRKKLDEEMQVLPNKFIPEKTVWNLYSTYGFPIDLTRLIAKEKSWTIASDQEVNQYKMKMENVKNSRVEGTHFKKEKEKLKKDMLKHLISKGVTGTKFSYYEKLEDISKILYIAFLENKPLSKSNQSTGQSGSRPEFTPAQIDPVLQERQKAFLITDRTCFYPEGGGPIGDQGFLKTETGKAKILDCQKEGHFIIHEILVLEGYIQSNQVCQMKVKEVFREGIKAGHTATHLLNSALNLVLGNSVRQAGSLVKPYYLRFDFTHSHPLAKTELHKIEDKVLENIKKQEEVIPLFKGFDQAKKEGFLYLKGENYDSKVRTIRIGEDVSKELCGGIHIQNTKEIKSFKIISERGVQSGVRRIEAYTGSLLKKWENLLVQQNLELRKYLKIPLPHKGVFDLKQSHSFLFKKEGCFWTGSIEKQNPFLKWAVEQDKIFKTVRKKIIHLDIEEICSSKNSIHQDFIQFKDRFQPLARQNLELREYLKMPLPQLYDSFLEEDIYKFSKEENEYFFLDWAKSKKKELDQLKNQWKEIKKMGWTKAKLFEKAKDFNYQGYKGKLLVLETPLEDRKMLSDLSDAVLFQFSSGVLVFLGKGKEGKYPLLLNLSKDLQKLFSANDIFKNTIVPLCKGKGGGKASFAQGSISDKFAFPQLESLLLKKWGES